MKASIIKELAYKESKIEISMSFSEWQAIREQIESSKYYSPLGQMRDMVDKIVDFRAYKEALKEMDSE